MSYAKLVQNPRVYVSMYVRVPVRTRRPQTRNFACIHECTRYASSASIGAAETKIRLRNENFGGYIYSWTIKTCMHTAVAQVTLHMIRAYLPIIYPYHLPHRTRSFPGKRHPYLINLQLSKAGYEMHAVIELFVSAIRLYTAARSDRDINMRPRNLPL